VIKNSQLFSDLTEIEQLFMDPDAAPWESLQAMIAFMNAHAHPPEKKEGEGAKEVETKCPEWPKSMPCCTEATKNLPTHTQSVFSEKPIICRGGWELVVDESVVIHGPIYIGRGVKIRKGGVIIGPAFIGDGVVIGCTRVKQSIIRAGAIIESYNRIRNCVIGRSVHIMPTCSINDEDVRGREIVYKHMSKHVATGLKCLGLIAGDDVIIGGGCVTYPGAIVTGGCIDHGTRLLRAVTAGLYYSDEE
jgi:ADP-glucose pyrophosphorylase